MGCSNSSASTHHTGDPCLLPKVHAQQPTGTYAQQRSKANTISTDPKEQASKSKANTISTDPKELDSNLCSPKPSQQSLNMNKQDDHKGSFHEEYLLLQKLGKGAFAQVYLVKPAPGNSNYAPEQGLAAKVTDLRACVDGKPVREVDSKVQQAVQQEVTLLRKLSMFDAVVHVLDSYFEDCLAFIVMERCDMSLLAALERLPELSERSLMNIFHQILKGLDSIHSVHVVHRDLKPDNFLCQKAATTDGFPIVKICDFGMAEQLADARPTLRGVHGTAPFMSPEMLGKKAYGTKTDVWSFFGVCYVLLLGKFAYQPVQSNPKGMKTAILAGVPEPSFQPHTSLPNLSSRAGKFLRTIFCRDPAARLSASEVLDTPDFWTTESDQWGSKSLRPMLHAAKRCGAFDTRKVKDDENDVDSTLRLAQRKCHGCTADATSSCSTGVSDNGSCKSENQSGQTPQSGCSVDA